MLKTWRHPVRELLSSPDPLGWAPLRLAIADHLRAFRGMRCAPEQLLITSGAGETLELLAQSIFTRGDKVLIEEPGYALIRRTLSELGLKTVSIPVDEGGLDIAKGVRNARAAVVTPARHYPLGMTMPLARRLALLEWARLRKTWIIEDGYDSEYRYQGKPLPALMGVDDSGVVVSLGSCHAARFAHQLSRCAAQSHQRRFGGHARAWRPRLDLPAAGARRIHAPGPLCYPHQAYASALYKAATGFARGNRAPCRRSALNIARACRHASHLHAAQRHE
jgi:Aminotransferase class I and II